MEKMGFNIDKLDMSKGPSSKAIAKMLRTSPIKLNDTVKSILKELE